MAVVGIGTDLVEVARVEAQLGRLGDRFAKRILTERELAIYHEHKQAGRYLAKRFAAKEAVAKALGTGIGRGVSFQHIEISNDLNGAPLCHLSDGAQQRLAELGGTRIHISISDERHYASAFAVAES
ncbi:holo-ACP synthase [Paraferrimonas sedimenticola]|uniref:Holo-[acyl-carrier-protein] synthase n=1 Tax=Paraferrimonas sedimenticola TaxID=375674 RepID=A0AA37RXU4_9GAMM|nr:holo-ACP synthase [Paraferrimonas sedimenticola]GLP97185.1 holo-[acyl-carrier-protein] synthase [Paraferrimonas sedimenticola]